MPMCVCVTMGSTGDVVLFCRFRVAILYLNSELRKYSVVLPLPPSRPAAYRIIRLCVLHTAIRPRSQIGSIPSQRTGVFAYGDTPWLNILRRARANKVLQGLGSSHFPAKLRNCTKVLANLPLAETLAFG